MATTPTSHPTVATAAALAPSLAHRSLTVPTLFNSQPLRALLHPQQSQDPPHRQAQGSEIVTEIRSRFPGAACCVATSITRAVGSLGSF